MTVDVMTFDDLMADLQAAHKALSSKVRVADGCITFDGWYDIPLQDCDTHRKVVAWIAHLSEKSWITPEMIGRFIALTVGREETP